MTNEQEIENIIWLQQNATLEETIERLKDMEIEQVELGIKTKEDAMKEIDKIEDHYQEMIKNKIAGNPEPLGKVFFCFTENNQSLVVPFECSQELYNKYPNQTRIRNIEDCDTFSFVCYPKDRDTNELDHTVVVYHDVADQIQKAIELKKRILPIRLWFTKKDEEDKLSTQLINIDIKDNEIDIIIGEIVPNWNDECVTLRSDEDETNTLEF